MQNNRKSVIIFVFLVVLLAGCASSAELEVENCRLQLSDMPLKGLNFTEMEVQDVVDMPFVGSTVGQAMIFNDGTLLLSRYESSEKAAELMDPDSVLAVFDGDAKLIVDAPKVTGDQTVWVRRTMNGIKNDAAMVRYGDYVLLADPLDRTIVVEGMLETFDSVLLEYISENPTCKYLHVETR